MCSFCLSFTSTSKNPRRSKNPTTYSTKNLEERPKEEPSAPDQTKIVTSALTVTFLLVALTLALVLFAYYIRRKR